MTDEQKARVKACKTADELIALAKEEGVELSEEQLNSISGAIVVVPDCHKLPEF